MKSQQPKELAGFTRISGFPHLWPYLLLGPLLAAASAAFAHGIFKDHGESMRMGATIGAAIITGIIALTYQHGFAKFHCKGCGKAMTKHRDPDTSSVTFHYACDDCRTFWTNAAVRFK